MWCVVYPDELYHHGILGQKWGVRRFQNKDGSLTSAGQKRYGTDEADGNGTQKKKINGKKIAVAAGVTVAAAVGVGLAVKYRKEIGSVVMRNKGATLDDLIRTAKKGNSLREKGEAYVKNFVKEQGKRFGSAAEKAVESSMSALFAAPVTVAAGYAAKKLEDKSRETTDSIGKQYVRDVLTTTGQAGIKSVKDSLGGNGPNKSGGKAFTDDASMARYNTLMNGKLANNKAEKDVVRKMRKDGKSIEEIEKYVNSL